MIKYQLWSKLANANSMLYKEDDGWIWLVFKKKMCNILVDPNLITFWLSLSKTELERSSPLWSAFGAAVLVSICSILTLLWTSEPLEKSIGEFLSSSNIPNDTKTEYNWLSLFYILQLFLTINVFGCFLIKQSQIKKFCSSTM